VAAGAIEAGMDNESVLTGTKESILENLYALLRSGDWVLVKGSRGMAMETVVQALKAWAEKNGK